MQLSNVQKACRAIEVLVSDDFCEDLEYKVLVHNDCRMSEEDVKLIERKIGMIYKFSHVANEPSCIKSHDDWVMELNKTYDGMVKEGYFERKNV